MRFKWNEKIRLACILFANAILLSSCALLPVEEPVLAPPLVQPAEPPVHLSEVVRKDIKRRISGLAVFEPVKMETHFFAGTSARLKSFHVAAGDWVKEGDLLAELEMEGLDIQLRKKKADLERRLIDLEQAQHSADRRQQRIAELELEIAEIELAETQRAYDNRQLIAKMSGQVTFRQQLLPGDSVVEYETIVTVADVSAMQLYHQGSARQLSELALGMEAQIAYAGKIMKGTVVQTPSSAPAVEDPELSARYASRVYIVLDELPQQVSFGDFADIEIIIAERQNTLVIPLEGLRSYMGRNYVQVMEGERRYEVNVRTGIESATEVEIIEGLSEGQQIILR